MSGLLAELSLLLSQVVAAAALIAGTLALVGTRRPGLAVGVLLDLLLAAGLLRLAGDPGWRVILTTAGIVALRRLIGAGLRAGGRAWSVHPPGNGPGRAAGVLRSSAGGNLVRPAWRS